MALINLCVTNDFRLPPSPPSRRPGSFPLPPPPDDWYATRKELGDAKSELLAKILEVETARGIAPVADAVAGNVPALTAEGGISDGGVALAALAKSADVEKALKSYVTSKEFSDAVGLLATKTELDDAVDGLASEEYVNAKVAAVDVSSQLAGYVKKTEVAPSDDNAGSAAKADHALTAGSAESADVADAVPWTGVTGKPTKVSAFENDKDYITSDQVKPGIHEGYAAYAVNAVSASEAHHASNADFASRADVADGLLVIDGEGRAAVKNAEDVVVKDDLVSKADLVDGKVPVSQLPSYVSDVIEYDSKAKFPAEGEAAKIYVTKDTNLTYRWSGTAYVEISPSVALGETAETAYAGNKGKELKEGLDRLDTSFASHFNNYENPHHVDAEQIGAMPNPDKVVSVFSANDGAASVTLKGNSENTGASLVVSDSAKDGAASVRVGSRDANVTIIGGSEPSLKVVGETSGHVTISNGATGPSVEVGDDVMSIKITKDNIIGPSGVSYSGVVSDVSRLKTEVDTFVDSATLQNTYVKRSAQINGKDIDDGIVLSAADVGAVSNANGKIVSGLDGHGNAYLTLKPEIGIGGTTLTLAESHGAGQPSHLYVGNAGDGVEITGNELGNASIYIPHSNILDRIRSAGGSHTAEDEVKSITMDAVVSKQDTIADLDDIRAGAAKGATALQTAPVTSVNGETGDVWVMAFEVWKNNDSIAVGEGAAGNSAYYVAIGKRAFALGIDSVAVGPGATVSDSGEDADFAVAIGSQAVAGGDRSVAIGSQAVAGGDGTVAIGAGISSGANQVVIGNSIIASDKPAGTVMLGSQKNTDLSNFYIGQKLLRDLLDTYFSSKFASAENLSTHLSASNPHGITANDVGALSDLGEQIEATYNGESPKLWLKEVDRDAQIVVGKSASRVFISGGTVEPQVTVSGLMGSVTISPGEITDGLGTSVFHTLSSYGASITEALDYARELLETTINGKRIRENPILVADDVGALPATKDADGSYAVAPKTTFGSGIDLPSVSSTEVANVDGVAAITPVNTGTRLGFVFSDGLTSSQSRLLPDGSPVLTQSVADERYAQSSDVVGTSSQLAVVDGQPTAIEHGKFYCWKASSTAPTSSAITLEDNGLENEARLYLDYRTAASQITLPSNATVLYRDGSVKLNAFAVTNRYFVDLQWFSTTQREGEWESKFIVVVNAYKVSTAE